jgi:hypothetical protein
LYDNAARQMLFNPVTLKKGDPLGFGPPRGGQVAAVAGGKQYPVPDSDYLWLRQVRAFDSADLDKPGVAVRPRFFSRYGRSGMQIRGEDPSAGEGSVAVYHFERADVGTGRDGKVGLQVKLAIERGGDLDYEHNALSRADVRVRNRTTGETSDPVTFLPETSRFTYVDVPAAFFRGGDFDVVVRGLTPGQWLGLHGETATTPSIGVVTAHNSFEVNLFKSLLILWLLSILVVVIAVFCSTFLSWPIAVVLTILLLLQDIFGTRDPAKLRVMTGGMEALAAVLRAMGKVLPDVTRFPVIEDINRGVNIPPAKVARALGEVAWYGLPLLVLTYLILRNKEVAP